SRLRCYPPRLLFFQAEDGIRAFHVTGVQTCALPISEGFARSINNYKLLPYSAINIIALILPWIEVTAGLLLLFGIAAKENAFILDRKSVVFLIAIGISLFRGLNIDCGCFVTACGAQVGI